MKKLLFLLLILGHISTIYSSEMMVNKDKLELSGEGMYEWMWLDVYTAKLFLPKGQSKDELYSKKLILELEYKMSLNGKDIAKQSVKEMNAQSSLSAQKKEEFMKLFESIFPDVEKGDRISAQFDKDKGIRFYLNEEKMIGEMTNIEDSKRFLDIWLGKETSGPELRKSLLNI